MFSFFGIVYFSVTAKRFFNILHSKRAHVFSFPRKCRQVHITSSYPNSSSYILPLCSNIRNKLRICTPYKNFTYLHPLPPDSIYSLTGSLSPLRLLFVYHCMHLSEYWPHRRSAGGLHHIWLEPILLKAYRKLCHCGFLNLLRGDGRILRSNRKIMIFVTLSASSHLSQPLPPPVRKTHSRDSSASRTALSRYVNTESAT